MDGRQGHTSIDLVGVPTVTVLPVRDSYRSSWHRWWVLMRQVLSPKTLVR